LLNDIRVDLMEEFDRNFERKAFFDQPWPQTTLLNRKGSLMIRSGALRRSLRAETGKNTIRFLSSQPYAAIQNEGGTISVTAKMKRFFWAMYYKAGGAISKTAGGAARNTARNRSLTIEAQQWKALALKKTGSKITIKPRPFIGHHHQVDAIVKRNADEYFSKLGEYVTSTLKR
jgi:phage gpG-like protein